MALTDYLTARYATPAAVLGLSGYTAVIADALELYGVDTEAEATDDVKLHRLADYAFWKTAKNMTALDYDFTADGATDKRSQMYAQVVRNFNQAQTDAFVYLPGYEVTVTAYETENDPYVYNEDRDDLGNF